MIRSPHKVPKMPEKHRKIADVLTETYMARLPSPPGIDLKEDKKTKQRTIASPSRQRTDIAEVEPKVLLPYEQIPGKISRKTAIEKLKEIYKQYSIETLLDEEEIPYKLPTDHCSSWLPIESYDFKDYEVRPPEAWIEISKANGKPLLGKGLFKDQKDNVNIWKKCLINSYNKDTNKFEGTWEGSNEPCAIGRVGLFFYGEDPRKFVQRFIHAFQTRIYADSLIRYNFYVENMPTDEIPDIESDSANRMLDDALSSKSIREKSSLDTYSLISEVNRDFKRSMNRIIFDKHMIGKGKEIIVGNLTLPKRKPPSSAPMYGLLAINRDEQYPNVHTSFCHSSFLIKREILKALQIINEECQTYMDKEILLSFYNKQQTIHEFKTFQETAISQCIYNLRESWVNSIKDCIKTNLAGLSKSWYNLNEKHVELYEKGKLKKLLTFARLIMQETLLVLLQKSLNKYVQAIIDHIPFAVKIENPGKILNSFNGPQQQPLFLLELLWVKGSKLPNYSDDPMILLNIAIELLEKAINEIKQIPQVEPKIVPDFFKTVTKIYLKTPSLPRTAVTDKDENYWLFELAEKLKQHLITGIDPLKDYLQAYKEFEEIQSLDVDEKLKAFSDEENPVPLSEIAEEVANQLKCKTHLESTIPKSIIVSIFKIKASTLKNSLAIKHQKIVEGLFDIIKRRGVTQSEKLAKEFDEMAKIIKTIPQDIEGLCKIKDEMKRIEREMPKFKVEIDKMFETYKAIERFTVKITSDEEDRYWKIYGEPKAISLLIEKQTAILDKEQEKFKSTMKSDQEKYNQKLKEIETAVHTFNTYQDINEFVEVAKKVATINDRLKQYKEESKKYNENEQRIGGEVTDYSQLDQITKDFFPYFTLWTTLDTWSKCYKKWETCKWEELSAEEVENTVDRSFKSMIQNVRFFKDKDLPNILSISEKVKAAIDLFRPNVPLVLALRTEGMKERHWQDISKAIAIDIKPDESFNLSVMLGMDLQKHLTAIQDVAERAEKEHNIETQLKKMKADWEGKIFGFKPFKMTGTFSLLGVEEIDNILNDQILRTQQLQSSSFKKQFEAELEEWNNILINMSETLEEWGKVQASWMYLQPIFDSPDIAQHLPVEAGLFKNIDKEWKLLMREAKQNPSAIKICSKPGLKDSLHTWNSNLDKIQKGLAMYLEEKRAKFARFYFLANDDLLKILSQAKEVENVRPHLRIVFENMHDLEFKPDKTIVAMFSSERERIEFAQVVDPKGQGVEYWMGSVERMMCESVKKVLYKAILDYPKRQRPEWSISHPGQCVLNGSQVHWTTEVEDAIKAHKINEYFEKSQRSLLDQVKLVRRKLDKMQKITLNALIVLDVHAKDVVENLCHQKVVDTNAFEWICQLRFYWEKREPGEIGDLYVKCVQTVFPYGYEYIGNQNRLVITPLTDKCFMTLMGALKLNLGGAPAGPAGTGKTESVKDLAKGIAKQCVVFNCSEGMDYKMVAKFFKGLSSAGAWCCFDEFNRINVEVLSVIAEQLRILFKYKALGVEEFMFEDSTIKMKPTFCVFITMNPGYAGRTELPDNLKALFRPVAMMVPDYALIAEIRLYSFGFTNARDLARKMVVTFKLSSEQLSSQNHYDYGMRAVTSVINAAGLLKFADPDMNEDQLLLRALRDVNVPKFLKDDLPLFENIIKDLFPKVSKPVVNYGDLKKNMLIVIKEMNLQPHEMFIEKCFQLYDTIQVRHGLMLVGPTGGGKTLDYQVLSKAISRSLLDGKDKLVNVQTHIINPKSITMNELYGFMELSSQEWVDGILPLNVSNCAGDLGPDKHWMIFDGPVDSLWIESMNTVLDDSKKLCLTSGQIIPLTDRMTMMFEVEDLQYASPATVSRCGMVYIDPESMGIFLHYESWLNTLPPKVHEKHSILTTLGNLYKLFVDDTISFLRSQVKEPVPTVDNNLIDSLTRIIDCFMEDYKDNGVKKITPEIIDDLEKCIPPMFLYAVIWSLCSTCDTDGQKKFNIKIRELIKKGNIEFPEEETIYDYLFDMKEKPPWKKWQDKLEPYDFGSSKKNYIDILIPTIDSLRMSNMITLLASHGKHVLTPGPTGTGKSVNINELLVSKDLAEGFQTFVITFSAQTTAGETQDSLDEKFVKRGKRMFGPDINNKFVLFVDDLNMPKKEQYGAQPPIELIRQWLDHSGWYDRKEKGRPFRMIIDMIILSAMGPPGGGRNSITQRMQRHFNIITYNFMNNPVVTQIFTQLLKGFLGKFPAPVVESLDSVMLMTLGVYMKVIEELLPTPNKSHYTFNLRDISKIIQGVCNANSKTTNEPIDIVRLWIHENMRVFGDRLINQEDKTFLLELLLSKCNETLKLTKEIIYKDIDNITFGDYMNGIEVDNRPYCLVNTKALIKKFEEYLENYNSLQKHPMKLVMFYDACDHISRIVRVLRQPRGNALLLGVGGSGRQSLSKLATFIANYRLNQVEVIKGYTIKTWRENIKKILYETGKEGKPSAFLFTDTQIIDEVMLEHINNILNSGNIPNLYEKKDMEDIEKIGAKECTANKIQPTKMNKFTQFVSLVRKNIHIIVAMSPMGEVFRNRLRKFPSLVNCCTIDWFSEWPAEALRGVAKDSLAEDVDLVPEDRVPECVELFTCMHKTVETKVKLFFEEARRRNYITPTSYLELLAQFKIVMKQLKADMDKQIRRLEIGLEVLAQANKDILQLQEMLKIKTPELEQTKKQVQAYKEKLNEEYKKADDTKKVVKTEEEEAEKKEEEATKLADEATQDLKVAEPGLKKATEVVKNLKDNQFVEMKTYNTLKDGGFSVAECCLILLDKPFKKPTDQNKLKKDPKGVLEAFKNDFLKNPSDCKESLVKYDKNNIPDWKIKKINEFQKLECWVDTKVKGESEVFLALFQWINAMVEYNRVLKIVLPKKQKVAELNEKLDIERKNLQEKRQKLIDISNLIASLEQQQREMKEKEIALSNQILEFNQKLERAGKLIGLLEGEKTRWKETVVKLKEKQSFLLGDCLLSSGMLSYCGCFTSEYRQSIESFWVSELDRLKILHSSNLCMKNILGDEVKIRQWNVYKLPNDNLSIENGIILAYCRRWPLMIDPQNQANIFIKNMGNDANDKEKIIVVKASDDKYIRQLENAIENGRWVLMERVGEKIDTPLDPLLKMQKTKQGTSYYIKIGDKPVKWSNKFRFFMTTTLPNPHYSPETSVLVTILNFSITPSGLEEQMLNLVVEKELPELDKKRKQLVEENARATRELKENEDKILENLSKNKDTILNNDDCIVQLQDAKKKAEEINVRVEEAKATSAEINATTIKYKPVAYRTSILFFCILDLSMIDPMYQYSLQWYQYLFTSTINEAPGDSEIEKRVLILNKWFTKSLYDNVCRSLFEKDKLLFSFLLTTKIMFGNNEIDMVEWRFFLAGPIGEIAVVKNIFPWISEIEWAEKYRQIKSMDNLPKFAGFEKFFFANGDLFKKIFDSANPHIEPLPEPYEKSLDDFEKLIVMKMLRPDKLLLAIREFIIKHSGKEYTEPPTFNLAKSFKDSTCITPLVFVLSTGSDPMGDFLKFLKEYSMENRTEMISLGQGQEKRAEKLIDDAKQRGGWVLLQNCHLSISFMPALEAIVENLSEQTTDFRMWLTSMPCKQFPVSILQNSVKMTIEPPMGLKANLHRTYFNFDESELNVSKKPDIFRKLLFGFCLFHAIVQDRRKFGPIGWNIQYEFNNEDLAVCRRQLQIFIDEYEEIPYKVLKYIGAEINYGGRVTDDKDSRLINALIEDFITPQLFEPGYKFSPSGIYIIPNGTTKNEYLDYITQLPNIPHPEIFGLHENAEITTGQGQTRNTLETILFIQPRVSAGKGKSREQQIEEFVDLATSKTPNLFNFEAISKKYPTMYEESMNTVLIQEVIRYNNLITVVKESLAELKKAIKGFVVMSEELELTSNSLYDNLVPNLWSEHGFLSMKPFSSWMEDFIQRVSFLQNWIDNGTPPIFWISGFFFPQAFLTGTLQNYARKHVIAIDQLVWEFKYIDDKKPEDTKTKPDDGCYIYGIFLEGARWNKGIHCLDDSTPMELYSSLPLTLLVPKVDTKNVQENNTIYRCPVYKVLSRRGTLSTTGHSTNFVLVMEIPTRDIPRKWVKAGVAGILALRY